jgi:hypothetical protein
VVLKARVAITKIVSGRKRGRMGGACGSGIRMTSVLFARASPSPLNWLVLVRTDTLPQQRQHLQPSVPTAKFASFRGGLWANFAVDKDTSNPLFLV